MADKPRDIYIPAESWQNVVSVIAPKPKTIDPAFAHALVQFNRYSQTIRGDTGDAIRQCHDHLDRFMKNAQEIVQQESGSRPERLGRPRDFRFGEETLQFQVFQYKGTDTVSIEEKRFATFVSGYDLFNDTLKFMEKKVKEGDLGIFKNTFLFIHKPLEQASVLIDQAVENTFLKRTTMIGLKADPHFMHIVGTEVSDSVAAGHIVRVLKPGYSYENREIQEGVVIVAS